MEAVRDLLGLRATSPTGKGVVVAVIDSGIDETHPDFAGRIHEKSAVTAFLGRDLTDRLYHGTHIAGIIGGSGVASEGRYRGIAPEVTLLVLKYACGPNGMEVDAAKAVELAIEAGADIINYSQGKALPQDRGPAPWIWPREPSPLEEILLVASQRGILCVVAAGNNGPADGTINRPGGLTDVLTVGALGINGHVVDPSSRGPYRVLESIALGGERRYDPTLDKLASTRDKPDVVVPGERICAPRAHDGAGVSPRYLLDPKDRDCKYLIDNGTSQATAVASGLAACLLQLARDQNIPLGANPGSMLHRFIRMAAVPLQHGTKNDFGLGLPLWSTLTAVLSDYAKDPDPEKLPIAATDRPTLRLMR